MEMAHNQARKLVQMITDGIWELNFLTASSTQMTVFCILEGHEKLMSCATVTRERGTASLGENETLMKDRKTEKMRKGWTEVISLLRELSLLSGISIQVLLLVMLWSDADLLAFHLFDFVTELMSGKEPQSTVEISVAVTAEGQGEGAAASTTRTPAAPGEARTATELTATAVAAAKSSKVKLWHRLCRSLHPSYEEMENEEIPAAVTATEEAPVGVEEGSVGAAAAPSPSIARRRKLLYLNRLSKGLRAGPKKITSKASGAPLRHAAEGEAEKAREACMTEGDVAMAPTRPKGKKLWKRFMQRLKPKLRIAYYALAEEVELETVRAASTGEGCALHRSTGYMELPPVPSPAAEEAGATEEEEWEDLFVLRRAERYMELPTASLPESMMRSR